MIDIVAPAAAGVNLACGKLLGVFHRPKRGIAHLFFVDDNGRFVTMSMEIYGYLAGAFFID